MAPGLGNPRQCSSILPRAPNGLLCPSGLGSNMPRLGPKRWRPGKKSLTLCFHYPLPGVRRALAMAILVTGVPATAAKNPTDPVVHSPDPPKCHGPSVRALPDLPNRAAAGPPRCCIRRIGRHHQTRHPRRPGRPHAARAARRSPPVPAYTPARLKPDAAAPPIRPTSARDDLPLPARPTALPPSHPTR